MEEPETSELVDSIIGADRPSKSSEEDKAPNAAMGPLGLLLHPYRRVLLVPLLLAIAALFVVSVVR